MKNCPEKERCLKLGSERIGLYNCSHCKEMIIAGIDPSDLCLMIDRKNKESDNGKKS